MLRSLDFVYVPTEDVDATARAYVEGLGGQLRWKVRGMGTTVEDLHGLVVLQHHHWTR